VPGPGVYNYAPDEWKFKKSTTNKIKPKKKMTYIDEIIQNEKR
jgi:hypothetical protein